MVEKEEALVKRYAMVNALLTGVKRDFQQLPSLFSQFLHENYKKSSTRGEFSESELHRVVHELEPAFVQYIFSLVVEICLFCEDESSAAQLQALFKQYYPQYETELQQIWATAIYSRPQQSEQTKTFSSPLDNAFRKLHRLEDLIRKNNEWVGLIRHNHVLTENRVSVKLALFDPDFREKARNLMKEHDQRLNVQFVQLIVEEVRQAALSGTEAGMVQLKRLSGEYSLSPNALALLEKIILSTNGETACLTLDDVVVITPLLENDDLPSKAWYLKHGLEAVSPFDGIGGDKELFDQIEIEKYRKQIDSISIQLTSKELRDVISTIYISLKELANAKTISATGASRIMGYLRTRLGTIAGELIDETNRYLIDAGARGYKVSFHIFLQSIAGRQPRERSHLIIL